MVLLAIEIFLTPDFSNDRGIEGETPPAPITKLLLTALSTFKYAACIPTHPYSLQRDLHLYLEKQCLLNLLFLHH